MLDNAPKTPFVLRRAKKKIGRAASEKKKRGLAGAEAKAAEAAAAASAAPKPLSKKKELLIDMIDSMLGEDTGEEVLYCSRESIDRLGEVVRGKKSVLIWQFSDAGRGAFLRYLTANVSLSPDRR